MPKYGAIKVKILSNLHE